MTIGSIRTAVTGNAAGAPVTGTAGEVTTPSTTSANGEMDKDMFLKLLVAQLKYQDPAKPTDSSQFMAQSAQFAMVEKLDALLSGQSDAAAADQLQAATAMVGRVVTWLTAEGTSTSGTVEAVTISAGVPTLKVGSDSVALADVTKVQNA